MFSDAYHKCNPDESQKILERVSQIRPQHGFRATGLEVLKKSIGFYPEATYYDLTQADIHPERSLQMVVSKKSSHILDGDFAHLHRFNLSAPLMIDRTQAVDYVRFYMGHIPGPYGLTRIMDTVDDLQLRDEPTPALRSSLNDKIVPLSLNASLPDGGYQIRGTILIKSTLYTALFDVGMTGIVSATMGRVIADVLSLHDRTLEG